MQTCNCPSCGAEVKFQSSVSMTCVCPYCRSLIVRHDKDVEAIGKMAELPDDISPFQIGTTGSYNNVHFSLIGRVRMSWEDGGWNEWFLWFDDGKKGWLAEAQGFLAISFEFDRDETPAANSLAWTKAPLHLGQDIYLNRQSFSVADLKACESVACEANCRPSCSRGRNLFQPTSSDRTDNLPASTVTKPGIRNKRFLEPMSNSML